MSSSENAKLEIESGQTLHAYAAMTNSGDEKVFTISGGTLWSGKSGYTPSIRPDGIVSGRNLLSTHADNNKVTIAAFTAYLAGVLHSVGATTATAVRPATAVSKVCSITLDSDGSTINVVEGTDGATTAFSETRGAAGGPPLIPVGDIEIGQVRMTDDTAAAIAASEIFQVVGTHCERYDYPVWEENNIGLGDAASVAAKKNAYIEFASALPEIHTGVIPKGVFCQYYTPSFSRVQRCTDFKPAENSHSITSTQIYGGTVGASSSSLGQGGFTAFLGDGVTDQLVAEKNQNLTVRYYPDENKTPYILTQGKIGLSRTFPPANQNQATVTITSEVESAEFSS